MKIVVKLIKVSVFHLPELAGNYLWSMLSNFLTLSRGQMRFTQETKIVENTTLMKTQTCTRQHIFDQHNESASWLTKTSPC